MVFKKYIKRGGKTYGPYLYENTRVNGKIITTYLGPAEEEKKRKNYWFYLIPVIALVLVLVFVFYQGNQGVLVGKATDEDDEGFGSVEADSGIESKGSTIPGGSSFGGGIVNPGGSITLDKPPILISVSKTFGISSGAITVNRIQQSGVSIVGRLTELRLPLEATENVNEVKISFPPGVRHVSFSGKAEEVSIRIKPISEVNIFDVSNLPVGIVEVIIKNLEPGKHNANFFMEGPYVSNVEPTDIGERVTISNFLDVSFIDVSVVVPLGIEVKDPDSLRIFSDNGEEVSFVLFDVEEGKDYEFVKFDLEISSGSDKLFEIVVLGVEEVETKKIDPMKAIVGEISIDKLSEECRQSLVCSNPFPCSRQVTANAFLTEAPLDGREISSCVSSNPSCSPVYEIVENCRPLKTEVKVIKLTTPSFFLESGEDIEDVKQLNIYDGKTEDRVAVVTLRGKEVYITFVQGSESAFLPPPSCYDGLQNELEEGIDCGGDCKVCVAEKNENFLWAWWTVLVVLFGLFLYVERDKALRIQRHLHFGNKALARGDIKKAISYYKLIKFNYHSLDHAKKKKIKQEGFDYYLSIKKALEINKGRVEIPKKFSGLPPLVFYSDKWFLKDSIDSDTGRIKKLIEDGIEAMQERETKTPLANYRAMKNIYRGLDKKEKRKSKRKCKGYYKELRKHLRKEKISFNEGNGVLPRIQIFKDR